MKFCCEPFRLNHEQGGQRGFSVFAHPYENGEISFIVQHRILKGQFIAKARSPW